MSKLRVSAYSISIDGYGAGPDQSLNDPMGVGGMALHQWVFGTRAMLPNEVAFSRRRASKQA